SALRPYLSISLPLNEFIFYFLYIINHKGFFVNPFSKKLTKIIKFFAPHFLRVSSLYILSFFRNSRSIFFFWKINSPASTRKLTPEQITEGYLNRTIPVHTRIMGMHPAMAAWIR